MPRFKDQAVCIRLIDWSETSQIVAMMTREHGKLRGLAKGSKRTSPAAVASYCGGFELLTLGQVVGISKPTAELATLTEWDLQEPHWHLRQNLRAQRLGMYGADLTGALVEDHDPHPNVFDALTRLLADLADPAQHEAALLAFQWRILEDCGYRPQLDQDVRTGEPLRVGQNGGPSDTPKAPVYIFDAQGGGLTADLSGNGTWRVRGATVRLLQNLKTGHEPSADVDGRDTLHRANRLLCAYARAILDRQLPTMGYVLDDDG